MSRDVAWSCFIYNFHALPARRLNPVGRRGPDRDRAVTNNLNGLRGSCHIVKWATHLKKYLYPRTQGQQLQSE